MNNTLKTLGLAATLVLSGCYTTRDLQDDSSQLYDELEERVENVQASTTNTDSLEVRTQNRRGNTRSKRGNVRRKPTRSITISGTNSSPTPTTLDEQLKSLFEEMSDEQASPSTTQTPRFIHASPYRILRSRSSPRWMDLMKKELSSMVRRYFGLPSEERELLLFNDLYETKGKLARYELEEHETQQNDTRYVQKLESRVQRQQDRINELKKQRDNYKTQANTQETKVVQEPCYEPQIIRQGPISAVSHQIADEDVAVRVGDDYIVLPFAGIVCPPKDSDQKACLSIQDIIEDFKARDVDVYERP